MKTKLLIFISFLLYANAYAQAPAIQWQKTYGGASYDYGSYLVQTADGGYIIAGSSSSTNGDVLSNHGNMDYWILKTDATGTIQWQKSYGGSDNEYLRSIKQTADGGYIISGNASSNNGDVTGNHGGSDIWIVKINATGDIQWQKCYGGTSDDSAGYVSQTSDGGYILSAIVTSTNGDVFGHHGGLRDCWVAKLDSAGTISWSKTLGGSSDENASYKILQAADGGYIFTAYTASTNGDVFGNHGSYDAWVVKLFSNGFVQWQKCYGGTGSELATDILQTSDGGYILTGASNSTDSDMPDNHGGMDYWVFKINSTGTLQWQKSFGGSALGHAITIQPTTDGGYVVIGYTSSNDFDVTGQHGDLDVWIVKINATGEMQWQKAIGGSAEDYSEHIIQTQEGGFAFVGTSRSTNGDVTLSQGISDLWMVKLGPEQLGISDLTTATVSLVPNPNNGNFIIDFNGYQSGEKTIIIYNTLGQSIYDAKTNSDNINVNLAGQPGGIYLYEIYDRHQVAKKGKIIIK